MVRDFGCVPLPRQLVTFQLSQLSSLHIQFGFRGDVEVITSENIIRSLARRLHRYSFCNCSQSHNDVFNAVQYAEIFIN